MKIIVLVILCIFNLSMYIKYLYNNLIKIKINLNNHITLNFLKAFIILEKIDG